MKSLYETPKVSKIYYSKKPLPLSDEIQELSIEEFQKLMANHRKLSDFLYTETLLVPDWFEPLDHDFSEFQHLNPAKKLVVCDMGETGFGIFAKELIKKGEMIAIYAGNSVATDPSDVYQIGLFSSTQRPHNFSEIMEQNIEDRNGLINPCYTAKRDSGLASIIQSLPQQRRLNRVDLPIATANLVQSIKMINGKKGKNVGFVTLTATRDIQQEEQLGWDYLPYSEQNISELYFDKNGISCPQQMLDFNDEFFHFFLSNLLANQLNIARDCLCAMHPGVLDMLDEVASLQINELLKAISTLPVEIENEQIYDDCNQYKHLSAMQALKLRFQSPKLKKSEVLCSANRFAFTFNSVEYKPENRIMVRQYLDTIHHGIITKK